jgi:hypothetical protein
MLMMFLPEHRPHDHRNAGQKPDKSVGSDGGRTGSRAVAGADKGTAKPLYVGSIPTRASSIFLQLHEQ